MKVTRRTLLASAAALAAFLPGSSPQRAFSAGSAKVKTIQGAQGVPTIPLPHAKSFVNATTAAAIDVDLMSSPGFSIDQLMELAGLSVASAVHDYCQNQRSASNSDDTSSSSSSSSSSNSSNDSSGSSDGSGRRVLLLCGPGNNGGDGLVAARHLKHFGYSPVVVYPKAGRSNPLLYANLVQQCEDLGIPVVTAAGEVGALTQQLGLAGSSGGCDFDVVVDALFGFSFSGQAREPYAALIAAMTAAASAVPTLSVDIPSGWDVNLGDIHNTHFRPAALISLTAPKECARGYTGEHYVGGRFITPQLAAAHALEVPDFGLGAAQVARYAGAGEGARTCADARGEKGSALSEGESKNEIDGGDASQVSMLMITASSEEEGKTIARALLADKLAACVNIVPKVTSLYEWEGQIEESNEVLLLVKSQAWKVPALTARVLEVHSYDVPEVIETRVAGGSKAYLDWVVEMTGGGQP